MKKRSTILQDQSFRFILLLIGIALVFLPAMLQAQGPPVPIQSTLTPDPCNAKFSLKFPVWRQDCGNNDNELGTDQFGGLTVKINDGSGAQNLVYLAWTTSAVYFPSVKPWNTSEFTCWDDNEYFKEAFYSPFGVQFDTRGPGMAGIPGLVAINPGNDSWVTYELIWRAVPASWYGKTITVTLTGDFDEGQFFLDQTKTMSFPTIPAPTGLQTTGNCTSIDVSWTKPNLPCPDNKHNYEIRYRSLPSGAFGNWIAVPGNGGTTTFSHAGLSPGNQFEYEVRTLLAGSIASIASDKVTGTAISLPPPPNSFTASNNNCNQTVLLTWGFVNGVDNYLLYRDGDLVETLSGNITNYTDMVPSRGVNYNYTLKAQNTCGISNQAGPIIGISPAEPDKPADVNSSISPGVGVTITWPDVANETSYKIERSLLGGGGSSFFDVAANVTSYLDKSLIQCQTYEYRVFAINDCKPLGVQSDSLARVRLAPDLSTVFVPATSLIASKGYFSNRVEISWSVQNSANFINSYKIYRKELGSNQDSTIVGTLNSGSNFFVDNFVEAGVLYEYFIIAESQCENTTLYSNVANSIGFRSPFGIVTGNVSYGGGIAVQGVRVSAESTSSLFGKSLSLNGAGSLKIKDANSLDAADGLLLETWIKPGSYASDFTLIEKAGSYSLKYIQASNLFQFSIYKSPIEIATIDISATEIMLNNFSHLAAQVKDDSLQLFVNGAKKISQSLLGVFPGGVDVLDNASDIIIGAGYIGIIDELRVWNLGKSEAQMKDDFSRLMNGGEIGLRVYLRMNEGLGLNAYDFSRTGTLYNRNHAAFQGNVQWSDMIPSASQLGAAAYSDALGNYVLNAPYHGNGEVFVLTPSYLVHEFAPSTNALFLGDGSSVHVGIDFLDKSSFKINGSLNYKNTTCGVKDATLKVDGQAVIVDGSPVKTDAAGLFEIQVPIGNHFIEVEQSGHVYSIGRFPATDKYDFQEDLAGVNFTDSTLVKVVGRVVGGLREAKKISGLGKSKNNIGIAQITLTSQQGNGCSTHNIMTVDTSGEYTVLVPPLKYVPTVSIPSNPTINFGVLSLVDLSGTPILKTKYDTLFSNTGDVLHIDSVQFHKQLDYIYRVNPEIAVFDKDGVSPFIGDSTYTYFNVVTGDTIIRDLRTNPLRWPVLHQQDDDYLYRCMIRVFEKYTNLATGVRDSVPTTDGTLHFNNELSHLPTVQIDLNKFNNPDTLKSLVYSFKTGIPNFSENTGIPAYSFTRKFEINLVTSAGQAIPWLPVAPANVPTGGDAIFRAYLLGTRSNGEQFVTFGPKLPEYVLRDPPGSGSTAKREVGSSTAESTNWKWNLGSAVHTKDMIFLGAKFNIGLGVSTATDVQNNNIFGLKAEISGGNSGSQSVTTTFTKGWSTYGGTDIAPAANSDLYIGKSKNIQFGIAEELAIIPNTLLGQIDPLAGPDAAGNMSGFSFGKKYGLSIVPGGYETEFAFNEYDIKNVVIPGLITLRNTMLQANPKYTSHLPISDPNYGKNNDDPVFGNNVSTVTPNEGEFADLAGPSYTYQAVDLQDTLAGDSVRVINSQVAKWEEAIKLNEWEKVNIGNQMVIDSLKEKELALLEEEYKEDINAYFAAVIGTGGGALVSFATIVTPIPGAAIAGYASFALTTASGIAEAELVAEYETYLAKKERIKDKFQQVGIPINHTFSGGITFEESMTHESASSYTRSIEYGLTADMVIANSGKISNNGLGLEKGIEVKFTSGRDWGKETSQTETVSYSLNANIGDEISVDVYPSMLGWGPIFKSKAGSRTSCPHEEAIVTSFYEPGTVISPASVQLEKPTLSVSPTILTNIPSNQAAVFNLTVGNESEANYTQGYVLRTISASNPFGAIVRFDGLASQIIELPGGTSTNKVMTITKGPGPVYNYDSILVVFTSQCQYTAGTGFNTDIADSVYVSAHFLPTCTDVTMASPEAQWVLNNSFNDTMPVAIVDYNINFDALEFLRVDYKPSDKPNWIGLQTFLKDTSGLNDPSLTPIPTGTPFTLYDWDVAQLPDGDYDLRILSKCELAEKASTTHSGIIDRINPHPFGNPSPADGILSPNDEISIRFNEAIYAGSINPTFNFDIRGVTNGTEMDHSTSLNFDGVDDYVEVTGGVPLQRRDFTTEFSVKRNRTGKEILISQGSDANERLLIGFDANDHFVFRINGSEVKSTATFADNIWHYFAVSYDFEGEKVELYVADENNTAYVLNNGNTAIYPDYVGAGKLFIGKNAANNSNFFSGNFHELRIWSTTRTLSEFSLYKSSLLSGKELGLLYNWRFDEAAGSNAEEHIRRRDATLFGPTWQVNPNGNSASFDGINDYLKIYTGDVNITPGMDFTLEFWFNSTQAGAATLFSNGTGTGLAADSLFSWNINKDASGLIHVKHHGLDFLATDEDYFDGKWHHFALVFQRSGNLTSYIDGNLQNAVQALPFKQLGGSHMYLGARGYTASLVETVENHFAGKMDEFRIWNMARKAFQIKRDKQNRMSANELGLKLYLPFESYSTDPTGVPILTPTFNEQIKSVLHTVNNVGGTTLSNLTPTIKLQRPVQAIAFTYSVNNDEIILTPTTSQEIIENVTLDITVEGLKDLHGNVMESPVTWIAYMDKNQVVWQDELLKLGKMKGESLSFTSGIINKGGAAKAFEILDVPDWLTVTPQSGSINPNSALAISFTVDPDMNIGDYTNDITLLTDFNFAERLTIELKVKGVEPAWAINPANFENSMGIIGRLKINNVVSTDDSDILVAMAGTQVRGVAHLEYVPGLDIYLAFMDVYSNASSGEQLSFRIWDASTGTVYSDVQPDNLTFTSNSLLGSISNPKVFTSGSEISFDVPVNPGWNWLGFPLGIADPTDIGKVLESLVHTDGDQIKGLSKYENYNEATNSWSGTLDNYNEGIQPEQLYKLKTAQPGSLTMRGIVIDPTTRPIDLVNNWNWIGFISVRNQPIAQALGNLNATNGDIIKGKTQFAAYDGSLGWIGSLKTLKPGQGFMYQSIGSKSFTYPLAGMFNNLTNDPEEGTFNLLGRGLDSLTAQEWKVKVDRFNTNMTLIGAISNNCGETLTDDGFAIGAFDELGIARGIAPIEKLSGQEVSYLTVAGEANEQLELRLLNLESGFEIDLGNTLIYNANQHIGNLDFPFEIEISDEVCRLLNPEESILASVFSAFPTVFRHYFYLDILADRPDNHARVSISNTWGQVVFTKEIALEEGSNRMKIDLSGQNFAAGLYSVELRSNARQESLKLIRSN